MYSKFFYIFYDGNNVCVDYFVDSHVNLVAQELNQKFGCGLSYAELIKKGYIVIINEKTYNMISEYGNHCYNAGLIENVIKSVSNK